MREPGAADPRRPFVAARGNSGEGARAINQKGACMKKLTLVGLLAAALLNAQAPTTRNVVLAWTASTSSGVTGYNVFRSASTTGPFTVPLNTTPVTATNYVDTGAVIGNTYRSEE